MCELAVPWTKQHLRLWEQQIPSLSLRVIRYLLHKANHNVHSSEDREPELALAGGSATPGPLPSSHRSGPGLQYQGQDRSQGSCLKVSVPPAPPRTGWGPTPLLTILQMCDYSDPPSLDFYSQQTPGNSEEGT